jgi:Carboxypeptidase regulatory-like domain
MVARVRSRLVHWRDGLAVLVNRRRGKESHLATHRCAGAPGFVGAVIPNAKVTVTNKENGLSIQKTSDSSGQYTTPFRPPGQYRVQIEALPEAGHYFSAWSAPVNATVNGLPWSGNNYLIGGVANNEPLNQFINISPSEARSSGNRVRITFR